MRLSYLQTPRPLRCLPLVFVVAGLSLVMTPLMSIAQEATNPDQPAEPVAAAPAQPEPAAEPMLKVSAPKTPTAWDLTVQGGIFMIPIGLCSIAVVAFAIERLIGLRAKKIVPPKLLVALTKLNTDTNGIDPRLAYDVCQAHSSPLANVIRAAILKVGRPHSELEKAVEDAVGREADEMAQNIRPINVSISISPLLGLLGTVQGMIIAFMVTSTTTATGAAKGQELAAGIYVALVTTFAGLCVAIPAILIANMLEGRIERLLRDMEDVFLELLPQFERFEGKMRITRKAGPSDTSGVILKGTASKSVPAPAAAVSRPTTASHAAEPVEAVAVKAAASPKGLWGVMGERGQTAKDE